MLQKILRRRLPFLERFFQVFVFFFVGKIYDRSPACSTTSDVKNIYIKEKQKITGLLALNPPRAMNNSIKEAPPTFRNIDAFPGSLVLERP